MHVCQSAHLSVLQLLTVSEQLITVSEFSPMINFYLVFVFIFSPFQTSERETKAASYWDDWEISRLQTRTCHFTGIVFFNANYRKYKFLCSGKGTADELHQSWLVVGSILLWTVFSVKWWHSPVMSFCQVSEPNNFYWVKLFYFFLQTLFSVGVLCLWNGKIKLFAC